MQTASPPVPTSRKSRRRYLIVGFVLPCIAVPFAYHVFVDWQRDRELAAIYRELDAEDPHWRWPDLIAHLPAPPPDERNAAVQVEKAWQLVKPAISGKLDRFNERQDGLGFVLWNPPLRNLAPVVVDDAKKKKR